MARKRPITTQGMARNANPSRKDMTRSLSEHIRDGLREKAEERRGKREKMSSEDLAEQRGLQRAAGSYRRKHRQPQLSRKKARQRLRQGKWD